MAWQRGASLVHVLLTAVVLGIVAGAAVPMLADDGRGLDATARAVAADLERTRSLAIAARTTLGIEFDVPGNRSRCVLGDGRTPSAAESTLRARSDLGEQDVARLLAAATSGDAGFVHARLHDAAFAGGSRLLWLPDGSPVAGGLVEFRAGSTWLRVRVQAGSGRVAVTAP